LFSSVITSNKLFNNKKLFFVKSVKFCPIKLNFDFSKFYELVGLNFEKIKIKKKFYYQVKNLNSFIKEIIDKNNFLFNRKIEIIFGGDGCNI